MSLPQLIFTSPGGGTIHKYEISGGKRMFIRFISCYLGKCDFFENIEDAARHLDAIKS
tara:strand:+ start:338 stop:511 length:174 start_codon:yes stop_codon:yes gene_type:complete